MNRARKAVVGGLVGVALAWSPAPLRARLIGEIPAASRIFAGAQAQNPPAAQVGGSESNWATRCASCTRQGAIECSVEQSVVKNDSRQLIALFRVRIPGDTRVPAMVIQLPLGLLIPAGLSLEVDARKVADLPIQACDASGCFITAPLPSELLAALEAGVTLRLRFQNLSKETIDVSMPLAGFKLAFESVK